MTSEDADEKMNTVADYCQSLILELRSKDVPEDLIGEVAAKVEGHVADTNEDPNKAFGSPSVYADHLSTAREPWWHIAITVLLAGIGGWFVARGLMALPSIRMSAHFGPPGWLWLALGLFIIPALISIHRRAIRVPDPFTGTEKAPKSRWGLATLIGLLAAFIVIVLKVIEVVDELSPV